MYYLIDKCILFFFLAIIIFAAKPNILLVIFTLTIIISTCLLNCYPYTYKNISHKNESSLFSDNKLLINNIIYITIVIFNIVLSLIYFDYILFLPIIFMDTIYHKCYASSLFFTLPFISLLFEFITFYNLPDFRFYNYFTKYCNLSPLFFFCLLIFYYLIAGLMAYQTEKFNTLKNIQISMEDKYRETQIILQAENKNLLKQQDYEINIATLNERNRIAREIHDNVGHMLSRSILQVGALIAINKDENITPFYNNLKETLNEAMNNIRSSVHNLHDESINLENTIKKLINDFTFCPVSLNYDLSQKMDISLKYCFITVTKEALNNIIKHTNAKQVNITMQEHPAFYKYVIEDINPQKKHPPSDKTKDLSYTENRTSSKQGIGLSNMRGRVEQLHGTFQCKETSTGFIIHFTIPKNKI